MAQSAIIHLFEVCNTNTPFGRLPSAPRIDSVVQLLSRIGNDDRRPSVESIPVHAALCVLARNLQALDILIDVASLNRASLGSMADFHDTLNMLLNAFDWSLLEEACNTAIPPQVSLQLVTPSGMQRTCWCYTPRHRASAPVPRISVDTSMCHPPHHELSSYFCIHSVTSHQLFSKSLRWNPQGARRELSKAPVQHRDMVVASAGKRPARCVIAPTLCQSRRNSHTADAYSRLIMTIIFVPDGSSRYRAFSFVAIACHLYYRRQRAF